MPVTKNKPNLIVPRNEQIYADQISVLYKHQAPLGIAFNVLLALLLVFAHWTTVPLPWLFGWLAALAVLMAARLGLIWRYHQQQPDPDQSRAWGRWYLILVSLSGFLWGGFAWVLIPLQTPEQRTLFLLIVAGLAMGGVPLLAVAKSAVISFLLALLLPIVAVLLLDSTAHSLFLGAATLLFLIGTAITALYIHQIIFKWLQLRHENQSLLQEARANRRDPLTGLPNRLLLLDRLERAMVRAKRRGAAVTVLYFEIAKFRSVNENLGHERGDELLQAVGRRLQEQTKSRDTVARLSGDEFAVLLEEVAAHNNNILGRVQELLSEMERPFELSGGQTYLAKFYVGVSQYPADSDKADSLLLCADRAAKWVKQGQRYGIGQYAHGKSSVKQNLSSGEQELRRAIEQRELCLYYQPQVDLFNYSILGLEALLRWNHPQRGVLSPDHVIPLAEQIGLIEPIGRWALEEACTQARQWQAQGFESLTVSVNVSARQFMQDDFVRQVEQALRVTEFAPQSLKLELTESMLLPNAKHTQRTLQQLQDIGVQLVLDDFGTGYASLSYLTRFPLNWLKIDKSFVQEVAAKPDNAAIVTTTITLAHSLGMKVIAEGVENDSQLAFIERHHGDGAQGYYFSRPLPATAATDWLRQPKLPTLAHSVSSRTVLLLEDDEIQQQLYSLWLKLDKYHIITATDASQAFSILARQAVDVVLVDYVLPGIDGVEFLRRVRSIYPETVRVMISASTDRSALAKAINDGSIFRFLDKPVNGDLLRQTVRQAMALQEKSARLAQLESV